MKVTTVKVVERKTSSAQTDIHTCAARGIRRYRNKNNKNDVKIEINEIVNSVSLGYNKITLDSFSLVFIFCLLELIFHVKNNFLMKYNYKLIHLRFKQITFTISICMTYWCVTSAVYIHTSQ